MILEGDTKFLRVCLTPSYIVPAHEHKIIEEAKTCLLEDVYNAVKMDEIAAWVDTKPALFASEKDLPSWLVEDDDDEDDPCPT